jgi:chloramphenicol 3-O-phosphotransferase
MSAGRVILLHGTSSSGKTTVARAVQRRSDEPWLWLGIDVFIDPSWADARREELAGIETLWVGVMAPLPVLEEESGVVAIGSSARRGHRSTSSTAVSPTTSCSTPRRSTPTPAQRRSSQRSDDQRSAASPA